MQVSLPLATSIFRFVSSSFFFHLRAHNQSVGYSGAFNLGCEFRLYFIQIYRSLWSICVDTARTFRSSPDGESK